MQKGLKYRFFRWKYLFLTIIGVWFSSLVLFFANPKGTQQWLTKMVHGEVKSISMIESLPVCQIELTHSWMMNDNVKQYWQESFEAGLGKDPYRTSDIVRAYKKGDLVMIESNDRFFVDTMYYSYPFAKQYVKDFIDELGDRFQSKLKQTDLFGTRLVLTSFLRTKSSIHRLMRKNRNALKCSSHLHGTTFDISYHTFMHNRPLSEGEIAHLKEMLAQALFEMRSEKMCYVKYEYFQTCFHVVCRKESNVQ